VHEYWLDLVAFWQELDLLDDDEWDTPADVVRNQKRIEKGRILLFLAGLNAEFDAVRARILSNTTLPSLLETYAEVRRKESRRETMPVESKQPLPESPAFVSKQASTYL